MLALSDVLHQVVAQEGDIRDSLKRGLPEGFNVMVDPDLIREKRLLFSIGKSKPQRIKVPALVKKLATPKYNRVGHAGFKKFLEWSPDTWGAVVDELFGSMLLPDFRVLVGEDLANCYEPARFDPTDIGYSLRTSCMSRTGNSKFYKLLADNPEIFQMWTIWGKQGLEARSLVVITTTGPVMVSRYGNGVNLGYLFAHGASVGARSSHQYSPKIPRIVNWEVLLQTEPLRYVADLQYHPNLDFMNILDKNTKILYSRVPDDANRKNFWLLQSQQGAKYDA